MTTTVYGASDDLIEVAGDIYEEFNPAAGHDDGESDLLTFSNGVVLGIRFSDDGTGASSPSPGPTR